MEKLKKTIIIIFFSSSIFCQEIELISTKNEIIEFSFNDVAYNKIAEDSIKILFNKQKEFYSKILTKSNNQNCKLLSIEKIISLNYKFEDLNYFSIPRYRLYRDGNEKFDCNTNIENFIVFNEYNKYQFSLISCKEKVLNKIEIPNQMFEIDRIYTPSVFTSFLLSKKNYQENYIDSLTDFSKSYTDIYNKIIYNKDNNFFFEIYGLRRVLFEIDSKTGLLYANFSSYEFGDVLNTEIRMLANDFIRKYVGEKIIKEICKGHYLEVDDLILSEGYSPCKDLNANNKKIYLKVVRN